MPELIPADDLLARTLRTYATLESYSDSGQGEGRNSTGSAADGDVIQVTRFVMRWRRPGWLFFDERFDFQYPADLETEWLEPTESRRVIWARPGDARRWDSGDRGVHREPSLDSLLRAPSMVSDLLSFVPSLLRGDAVSARMPPSPSGFMGTIDEVEGAPCLRVAMRCTPHSKRAIWIDLATALIHRADLSIAPPKPTKLRRELERALETQRDLDKEFEPLIVKPDLGEPEPAGEPHDPVTGFPLRLPDWDRAWTLSLRYLPSANPVLNDSDFEFEPPGG